jgi:hypothetical protein
MTDDTNNKSKTKVGADAPPPGAKMPRRTRWPFPLMQVITAKLVGMLSRHNEGFPAYPRDGARLRAKLHHEDDLI